MTTLLLIALIFSSPVENEKHFNVWGQTGHRIVGNIAAEHLTPKSRKTIKRILGNQSMAIASTWMDKIKSDPSYDHTHDWHWVTIPNGMTYDETNKNPNGDLIQTLRRIIAELKSGDLSPQQEQENLKMLIHLVGDVHQPLHVGTGDDRGGNDTKVEWFYEPSNLHRVWDSEMINDTRLSYTEFSEAINHPTKDQIRSWQNSSIIGWANESKALREQIYDLPDDRRIGYRYQYENRDLLDRRILQAGIRLAGVLNEIYG